MEIWVWIILAWMFSKLALGKHRVGFEHLLWILLPVDMYGITIAGVTLKPYMFFCGVLFVRMLMRRNTKIKVIKGWTLPNIAIVVLLFVLNMFNSNSIQALSAPSMLMVVWFCTVIYTSNCGKDTVTAVPEVMVATGIGYGLVFVIGYVLLTIGVVLPGISTAERLTPGFFLQFSNMFQGALIVTRRLRGFTIDPNTIFGTFVFSGIVCVLRILEKKASKREWLCLGLSVICLLLSNSRMGMIGFTFAVMLSIIVGYQKGSAQTKDRLKKIGLLGIFVLTIVLITTDWTQNLIYEFVKIYANRSDLNDTYGRFSIWREAISILMSENMLFGIGMGQMQFYTSINRACHNTWLECICGNGIIMGSVVIFFLLSTWMKGAVKTKRSKDKKANQLLWCLIVGVTIVVISLVSVDNLTYSYLWFGLSMLMAVMPDDVPAKLNTMRRELN